MRLILSVIGAFLLIVAMASHPQTLSQQEEEIKNLEGERGKAQVQGDIAKLDEVLAPASREIFSTEELKGTVGLIVSRRFSTQTPLISRVTIPGLHMSY